MPVNFVQVKQSLLPYSRKVKALKAQQAELEAELWQCFSEKSDKLDELRQIVLQAARANNKLYCACPTNELLLTQHSLPQLPIQFTILAADGSQIQPSRHRAIQFCIINVGVIKARMGSSQAPEIYTHSQLLDYDQLFTPDGGLIDEDTVSLRRDHAERAAMAQYITPDHRPILTLADGPLGIYQGTRSDTSQQAWQASMVEIYQSLEEQGVIAAGYIDKPGSDLLGRLFSLLHLAENELGGYTAKNRRFKGISDAQLLSKVVTQPGARSAIFQVFSTVDQTARQSLDVHFFYLNIGKLQPYLVRVEFPAWVSQNPERIDLLHAAIYNEVQVLDTHPYPYILHRAHELAVIHFDEYAEVERLLLEAYQQEGIPVGIQSNKEANKIISGK